MTPVPAKVLKRVRDLVRLAGSSSFEGERTNAAVEAVRLIHLYDIPIGEPPPKRTSSSRVTITHPPRSRPTIIEMWSRGWHSRTAPKAGVCDVCGEKYERGETVYHDPRTGANIHVYWPCDE